MQLIKSIKMTGVSRFMLCATLFLVPVTADAQELEPRKYSNIPVGVNFVAVGYGYNQGNIFLDPALPVEDADATIHAAFVRYIRSFSLFGLPSKATVTAPWASGHWEGVVESDFRSRNATGFGDARIAIETLFWGAPALTKSEFAAYRPKTVAGASLDIIMPTGEYDPSKLVNLGSNRWVFNPEIGVAHNFEKWVVELGVAAGIYSDNDDFFGGNTLEQDDFFALKIGFVRTIRPGFWLSFNAAYGWGGQTSVGGITKDTEQSNARGGVTLAYAIRPNQGLVFSLASGYTWRAGPDFDSIGIAYQYSWGGGQ